MLNATEPQIEQFLNASAEVAFSAHGDDLERYAHISRVLKRFDYPRCSKHDRGVLLRYLQHTSGYSRAQVTRLVARWHTNRLASVPLVKRYQAPAAPFARKYTALDIDVKRTKVDTFVLVKLFLLLPPGGATHENCFKSTTYHSIEVKLLS